jgi:hypothetical protein
MLADRGLRQAQRGLYFAHAQDPALEQFYHLHPVGVRKRLHDFDEFSHKHSINRFF